MGIDPSKEVDHEDRDGLNCTRGNLGPANRSENMANTSLHEDSTSGFKGVSFRKDSNKWRAYICLNYEMISLGSFGAAHEAAHAYNVAAVLLFGKFASLNVIPSGRVAPGAKLSS